MLKLKFKENAKPATRDSASHNRRVTFKESARRVQLANIAVRAMSHHQAKVDGVSRGNPLLMPLDKELFAIQSAMVKQKRRWKLYDAFLSGWDPVKRLVTWPWFDRFFWLVIILNTAILAYDHHRIDQRVFSVRALGTLGRHRCAATKASAASRARRTKPKRSLVVSLGVFLGASLTAVLRSRVDDCRVP